MSREDEIKQIAYELWDQEGRPEGRAEEHWARAEQIWDQRQRQKAVVAPTLPKPPAPRPVAQRRKK